MIEWITSSSMPMPLIAARTAFLIVASLLPLQSPYKTKSTAVGTSVAVVVVVRVSLVVVVAVALVTVAVVELMVVLVSVLVVELTVVVETVVVPHRAASI
jgi:hypothetical protein